MAAHIRPPFRLLSHVATWALAAVGLTSMAGCNDHVFTFVEDVCSPTLAPTVQQPEDLPADILLVIDNSGSMCEEQENLVENFFDPDCPITDLDNVPDDLRNPSPEKVQELSQSCGFIQILAAFDNEFRVGVITTDVGQCDNRFAIAESEAHAQAGFICAGQAFPNWGRRPQRGCMQGAPGRDKKFIAKGDTDIGEAFTSTLDNIQTFGSGFERGLDAMEVFLDGDSVRAPGCEDDLDNFIRQDARLIVIFVTDEDDCSHADGAFGAVDENTGESCDNPTESQPPNRDPPAYSSDCYEKRDVLSPVSRYSDFLNSYKGVGNEDRVSVAVIAGGVFDANGGIVPAGCKISNQGNPDGACEPAFGQSLTCAPEDNCCDSDSGDRYFTFARQVPQNLTDSICYASFRSTMVNIAEFIAAQNQFQLQEDSADIEQMTVHVCREGAERTDECELVTRIPNDVDPSDRDGWQLSGTRTINLYGSAILQPGQELRVFAPAVTDDSCSPTNQTDAGL